MDAADFQSAWSDGMEQSFAVFAQTVIWNNTQYQAVVDALPFSNTQKSGGGGMIEEFVGSILFLKSDFPGAATIPQPGDSIQIGKRLVRVTEIANAGDEADPTLHCYYKPKST